MSNISYKWALFFLFVIGCQTFKDNDDKQNGNDWLEKEFAELKTKKDREFYLIEMFDRDQELRISDTGSNILEKNNFDVSSQEYQDFSKKIHVVDSLNFMRIKKYLDVFGYPKTKYEDYKANYSINAVCLHQPFQNQKEVFPIFYEAYKEGYLSAKDFYFFLNKMHIIKYQNSFQSEKSSTSEDDRILDLINKLDLIEMGRDTLS